VPAYDARTIATSRSSIAAPFGFNVDGFRSSVVRPRTRLLSLKETECLYWLIS
jgi:hypothetical protein